MTTNTSSIIDSYPRLHQLAGKVLEGVAELLEEPAAWTQDGYAADRHGEFCFEHSDEAVCWSLTGAVARVTHKVVHAAGGDETTESVVHDAVAQRLIEAMALLDDDPRLDDKTRTLAAVAPLYWFNEHGAKTHGDIVALIRRATEAIETDHTASRFGT